MASHHPWDVLCLGELVVDLISTEAVQSLKEAATFRRFLGGAPTNVARNIAALGGRSALLAAVGKDELGEWARETLQSEGVDVSPLVTAPAPTTLVLVTRHTTTPDFLVYRGADRYLEPSHIPEDILERTHALHVSAFALSQPPLRDTVFTLMRGARERNLLISLDPNYHPRLWDETAQASDVIAEAVSLAKVVKPSRDDCFRLFGDDNPERCAQQFLNWGAQHVFFTQGANGSWWFSHRGDAAYIPPHDVPVMDVTGAGDAFLAGLLMALLDGLSPHHAARVGQHLAERKLQHMGPLKGHIDRHQIYAEAEERR